MMRKRNEVMIKSYQNTITYIPDKFNTKDFNLIENFDIDHRNNSSDLVSSNRQILKEQIMELIS